MIKEQEAGIPTAEVCRKYGLSQGTFYKYKSKYGGIEVSDVAKGDIESQAFSYCSSLTGFYAQTF